MNPMPASLRKIRYLALSFCIAAAIVAPLSYFLIQAEDSRYQARLRASVLEHAGAIRAKLESALSSRLDYLGSLAAFVSVRPAVDQAEFEALARIIVDTQPGIRSVQLAKGGVIGNVYPLAGNEPVLGMRLSDLPVEQLEAVSRSVSSRGIVVSGPFELVQGGLGVIGRIPVFARTGPDPGAPGLYWGQATIVIDADRLFADAGLMDSPDLVLAIAGKDGRGASGASVFGNPQAIADRAQWLDVALPTGSWRLYAALARGGGVSPRQDAMLTASVAFWLVTGLALWGLLMWPLRLRQAVEAATMELKAAGDNLESQICTRTNELEGVNARLSREIEYRTQAEAALRASEGRLRDLIERAPIGIFESTPDGRYLIANDALAAMYGYDSSRELIENIASIADQIYVDPEERGRLHAALAVQGSLRAFETQRKRRDGTRIWVSLSIRIKRGENGEITGYEGFTVDITARKLAEEALTARGRQLRVIFENSPLGLVYFDGQGTIQNCNDVFLEQMGSTREKLIGQNLLPQYPESVRDALLTALSGQPASYEGPYTSVTSGKSLYIHIMFNPASKGQQGSEVIASVEDVTAAREREGELTRLWKIVEQSPASIVITDAKGWIEYVNPYFTVITGYEASEVVGANPKLLKSGVHQPEFYREMWRTLCSGAIWRGEICNRKKNGEIYWEDASISPITGEDGRITHFVAVKEDITEKKSGEARLKNTLAELETIFNASSVGIAQLKRLREFIRVNARFAELFGYREDELSNLTVEAIFVNRERYEEFFDRYASALAGGGLIHEETQFRCKDGSLFWCSVHGRMINPGSSEAGSIWVFDDITARKDLETLREDVERIMRHDLKGPLNGIINLPRLVASQGNLTAEQSDLLEYITESGTRMLDQIELSLDLYKMEKGEYIYQPRTVDLGRIVARVLLELGALARARQVEIKARALGVPLEEAAPVWAVGDELLSHSVATNIVKNAIEASTAGQAVAMTIESGDEVVFCVHNPATIPDAIKPVFFEKYTTSGKKGGTGLGTYSARLMAEIQRGRIAVTSQDGLGTTVTFTLPAPARTV